MFDYGTDTVLPPSGHAAATAAAGDAAAQARAEILAEAASISNAIGAMDDSVDKAALLANLRAVVGSALNSLQNASPASVSGILAQLKNLSKEMQQDAQEEVLSKDHTISAIVTTSKSAEQARQIANRLDAIAQRQAEEASAAREAYERDGLVSARRGNVARASDEEIAEARSRLQEARESGDTVQIRRAARRRADAEGGTEAERLRQTRANATAATAQAIADRTVQAVARGDMDAVGRNVVVAAEAAGRNIVVDPVYGMIARGCYDRFVRDPQNAARLRAIGITSFEQFEAHRQENTDISYQQAAAYRSARDGDWDWNIATRNTLSDGEFSDLANLMIRFSGLSANDMASINRRYRNNSDINSNGGIVTINDIHKAMKRAHITSAEADLDHDGKIELNEINSVLARLTNSSDHPEPTAAPRTVARTPAPARPQVNRTIDRTADNLSDAAADLQARTFSPFGRAVDAQLATLNAHRTLVQRFDTDRDGRAELHEVIAGLRALGLDNATDFGNGDRTLTGAELFNGMAARIQGRSPRN